MKTRGERMTEEEQALRLGVCARLGDIAPRLVYADWLAEHGREDEEAFTRIACPKEAGKLPAIKLSPQERWLRKMVLQTLGPMATATKRWVWADASLKDSKVIFDYCYTPVGLVIKHGFITEIQCTLYHLFRHYRWLFTNHPIERVWPANQFVEHNTYGFTYETAREYYELTCSGRSIETKRFPRFTAWFSPESLPAELLPHLQGECVAQCPANRRLYASRELAVDDLSRAIVQMCRARVGL